MSRFVGLRPKSWICVGQGYAREEIKASLLASGQGFVAAAIGGLDEVCLRIVKAAGRAGPHEKPVLGPLARQEVLRAILSDRRLRGRFDELAHLRRQGGFWRRLDRALERGRLAFAHGDEERVYEERLRMRVGARPLRDELRLLSSAYEAWMRAEGFWDLPLLLAEATAILDEGWPAGLDRPESIHHYSVQAPESRELAFLELLGRHSAYRRMGEGEGPAHLETEWSWERWHTIDDCADALASELSAGSLEDVAVLIPDDAAVRRGLGRALGEWGIPLSDPRDPTRIKWDEGLKRACLPLELVARGFERERVAAWRPEQAREIYRRGVRAGIRSYQGGKLVVLHQELQALERKLGGKKTCAEIGRAHLEALEGDPRSRELLPFFEALWKKFAEDLARVKEEGRKAPPLLWLERVKERLAQTPPPLERERPFAGLDVYRLHQAVPRAGQRPRAFREIIWLAAPSDWLTRESVGDDWYTEREREVLSGEFAVRSGIQAATERLSALRAWVGQAARVRILDPEYDFDGRERESAESLLGELVHEGLGTLPPETPVNRGSHPRWRPSYRAERLPPVLSLKLPPLPLRPDGSLPSISATALDHYSRCGFLALAYDRWKLSDLDEPGADLWPHVRGNLLHSAVKILTQNRVDGGGFSVTPEEALDRAWREHPPEGVLQGLATERLIKTRLLLVLRAFCEKEREYIVRSAATTVAFDDRKFSLLLPSAEVVGKPDRIDENEHGFFIIDYKASGALPHGEDMVELGYRLQLPFYALASRGELGKDILGLQFVELSRKGARTRGIFFREHNGKEPGRFTNARSNSKSLLATSPAESWSRLSEHLELHARGYVSGEFEARPKKDEECPNCRVSDLCGLRRKGGPDV
jgi:hypothetical protein